MFEWTPLHEAAANGHLCVVEYLVNQNADINAKNSKVVVFFCCYTPLHLAADNGFLSVVEYLVYKKAEINAKDNDTSVYYSIIRHFI